ncbi:unnamed protein product, partial [Prorocentrum cordatum]
NVMGRTPESWPQKFSTMEFDARIWKRTNGITSDLNGVKDIIDQARTEAQDARRAAEEIQDDMAEVDMEVVSIRNDLEGMHLTNSQFEQVTGNSMPDFETSQDKCGLNPVTVQNTNDLENTEKQR